MRLAQRRLHVAQRPLFNAGAFAVERRADDLDLRNVRRGGDHRRAVRGQADPADIALFLHLQDVLEGGHFLVQRASGDLVQQEDVQIRRVQLAQRARQVVFLLLAAAAVGLGGDDDFLAPELLEPCRHLRVAAVGVVRIPEVDAVQPRGVGQYVPAELRHGAVDVLGAEADLGSRHGAELDLARADGIAFDEHDVLPVKA